MFWFGDCKWMRRIWYCDSSSEQFQNLGKITKKHKISLVTVFESCLSRYGDMPQSRSLVTVPERHFFK
jgi:hypothetical protein